MPAPLMQNKNAQAAYRLSRPRRQDTGCFCGQTGSALMFGLLFGYTTLLCTGLHFVTTSIGEGSGETDTDTGEGGRTVGGAGQTGQHSLHHNHIHEETNESMLPVILVMAVSTSFGFLGPLHDNPLHQSKRDFLILSLSSLLMYSFLFWTYEVESLLGIFCCATIVSLVLHPLQAMVAFCLPPTSTPSSCNPCVWLYQSLCLKHHHLKTDEYHYEKLERHSNDPTPYEHDQPGQDGESSSFSHREKGLRGATHSEGKGSSDAQHTVNFRVDGRMKV